MEFFVAPKSSRRGCGRDAGRSILAPTVGEFNGVRTFASRSHLAATNYILAAGALRSAAG